MDTGFPCPICSEPFTTAKKKLNMHGKSKHPRSPECNICSRVCATHDDLLNHMRGNTHRKRHAAMCHIRSCSARSCYGEISQNSTAMSGPPFVVNGSTLTSSKPQGGKASADKRWIMTDHERISLGLFKVETKRCYICNKSIQTGDGLVSHAKSSISHRQLHARNCSIPNCDARTYFGQSAPSRLVKADSTLTTVQGPDALPPVRKVVEPGPPDPVKLGPKSDKLSSAVKLKDTPKPKDKPKAPGEPNVKGKPKAKAKAKKNSKTKPLSSPSNPATWSQKVKNAVFNYRKFANSQQNRGIPKWPLPLDDRFDGKGKQWSPFRFGVAGPKGLFKCYYFHAYEGSRRRLTHECAIF